MNEQIIELVQLPVIDERLQTLKAEWEQKTAAAVALSCTEANKQEIKKIRTALTKEFNALEESRKGVKKAILDSLLLLRSHPRCHIVSSSCSSMKQLNHHCFHPLP